MHISLRGYLMALLVTVLGIAGQWSAGPWQQIWRYPAAVLVLAMLAEALLVKRNVLHLRRQLPLRTALGRSNSGVFTITNHGSVPLRLQVAQPIPAGVAGAPAIHELSVAGFGSAAQSFNFLPQVLGTVDWDLVYTRVRGLFGLAWWNRNLSYPSQLTVEPDLLRGNEHSLGLRKSGGYDKVRAGTGSELLFLRDYRPGDSIRAVDWKATARSGKHMVRVYSEQQHLSIALAIDAGRTSSLLVGDLNRYHHYVNIGARLAEKAVTHGDVVSLVLFADTPLLTLPPARGLPALVKIRQALALTRVSQRESNPLAAVGELQRRLRHRSLVVLFTDVDLSDVNSQLLSAVRLLSRKHLPLIATLLDPHLRELATAPALQIIDPYHALAAMEMEHATRATLLHLQRMGACVVRDKAERLDDSVLAFYEQLRQRRRI